LHCYYTKDLKKEKIDSALKNSRGIERNLLAKRFLEKISYSPESIKLCFFIGQNPLDFGQTQNSAPLARGGADCLPQIFSALPQGKAVVCRKEEKLPLGGEKEFASLCIAPQKNQQRTFEITLPNLIHKLRTGLPKAGRKKKI
jgi:hypothetical protein